MKKCRIVRPFPAAFEREHSLEVQVPFLQKTLSGFKIVPIVTGAMNNDDYKQLVGTFASLLKDNPENVLIVASSDMSHFHPYDAANTMDNITLKDIAH
jgi:AmmeMemoRadiSam system protein B